MTPLGEALRKKFGTPKEALLALGLDESLLSKDRAGSHLVGDSKQEIITMKKTALLSRMASVAHGAILAHVMPKLAADQKIDVSAALAGITAENFKAKRPAILKAVGKAAEGKLAADAKLDGLEAVLVALDEVEVQEAMDEDDDDDEAKKKKAEDDAAEEEEKKKKAAEDAEEGEEEKKKAMDSAINSAVTKAVAKATADVRAEMLKTANDIRTAEEAVRPYIGKLAMAHDSADAVYRTALTSLGVNIDGVHPSALPAILKAQPLPGAGQPQQPVRVAMDAAGVSSFQGMFPETTKHIVKSL